VNVLDGRTKLGAILAPAQPTDPQVLTNLVDSIPTPALMLGWGDPWLEFETPCFLWGRLIITAVASRLLPGEGVAALESLVAYVLGRLNSDPDNQWPLDSVSGPRVFAMSKTTYLAARITLRVQVER
jgi:hypothetical protein